MSVLKKRQRSGRGCNGGGRRVGEMVGEWTFKALTHRVGAVGESQEQSCPVEPQNTQTNTYKAGGD